MDLLLERRLDEGPYPATAAFVITREWAVAKGLPDPGPHDEEE
jgi:hypothetical protein